MLLTLNDDCLYLVCKQMDVEGHISFSQTSERLRSIVSSYYITHKKVTLGEKIWSRDDQQIQEILGIFGSTIGPYIKELSIKSMEGEQLNLLDKLPLAKITELELETENYRNPWSMKLEARINKYLCSLSDQLKKLILKGAGASFFNAIAELKFPKVTELRVYDSYDTTLHITEEMFPALTKLKLSGRSTYVNVHSLCKLKNLTTLELDIGYDYLTQQHLQMIFSELPLKKLRIYFNKYHQDLVLDGISKCQTIEELVLDDGFSMHDSRPLDELTKLKNLRRVTVGSDIIPLIEHPNAACKYLSLSRYKWLTFFELNWPKKLEHLQHLKIGPLFPLNRREENLSNDVIQLLMNCHNLRIFEVFGPAFDAIRILEKMAQASRSISVHRKETLLILCGTNEELVRGSLRFKNLSFPSFVKLSFASHLYPSDEYPVLQCDWKVKK